jgi:predicted RecB family nuclease
VANPAFSESTRQEMVAAIRAHLEQSGSSGLTALHGRFPSVSQASFWRCVRAVKADRADAAAVVERVPVAEIPAPPVGLPGDAALDVGAELRACLDVARRVQKSAEKEDGTPRDANLMLRASEHRRRVVETGFHLAKEWADVRRIEGFLAAVVRALEKRDKTLAAEVIADVRRLQREWFPT